MSFTRKRRSRRTATQDLRARKRHQRRRSQLERLEDRVTPAAWMNLTFDGFEDVFGSTQMDTDNDGIADTARSEVAKNVVRAAARHLETFIYDLNQSFGNKFDLTVRMDSSANAFGGTGGIDDFRIDPFTESPTGGTIKIGPGLDGDGDGRGDGVGYYLDPNPDDWAEFPNPVTPFVGNADTTHWSFHTHDFDNDGKDDIDEQSLADFYSLVLHEMVHALGFGSQAHATITDTNDADMSGPASGRGRLWVWNSSTVPHGLLTGTNGDEARDAPVHVANVSNIPQGFGDKVYSGLVDLMNPYYASNQRRLLSQLDLGVLTARMSTAFTTPRGVARSTACSTSTPGR